MMRLYLCVFFCAAHFFAPSHATADQIVYADQNFLFKDWTTLVLVREDTFTDDPSPMISLGSVTRQTTGGVSDSPFMRSIHNVFFGDIVNTSGIYVEESYDPRQGAISALDFSYSVNHFNAAIGTATGVRPALLQSGRLFVGPVQGFSGDQWVPLSAPPGLNANDFFSATNFWFNNEEIIRPDFSAFGDPIQFGYTLENRNLDSNNVLLRARGLDNWSVTLNLAEMSDIHGDGVDSVDFDLWKGGFGTADTAHLKDGDFNLDTDVDGLDFLKWQRQFGSGVPTFLSATTIPEPSSLNLLTLLAVVARFFRWRLFRHPWGLRNID